MCYFVPLFLSSISSYPRASELDTGFFYSKKDWLDGCVWVVFHISATLYVFMELEGIRGWWMRIPGFHYISFSFLPLSDTEAMQPLVYSFLCERK